MLLPSHQTDLHCSPASATAAYPYTLHSSMSEVHDGDEYVGGLGLTDAEFAIVKSLGSTGSRRFLCKQGTDSVQCEFDLGGMNDFLAVLSSTTDNVELLDQIRAEVGDAPTNWLPLFYQRVRNRRSHARRAA